MSAEEEIDGKKELRHVTYFFEYNYVKGNHNAFDIQLKKDVFPISYQLTKGKTYKAYLTFEEYEHEINASMILEFYGNASIN